MSHASTGLFDLQVNGFAGIDFNDAGLTPATLDHALGAMLKTGVTACLPTIITASRETLLSRFRALDDAVAASRLGSLMVPGYHLEGPFLNPADGAAGCHSRSAMIAGDIGLVDAIEAALRRPILLLTVAPERPGVLALIGAAAARGKVVAIGHSAATLDDVTQATAAGATLSTHLGNALAHQGHKFDNPLFAQLGNDALFADFIADGIHVPPHALKVMMRARGLDKSILVTDAVAGAAAPPGTYTFAGMRIERAVDGSVRQSGGTALAGSALMLDAAVRNVVTWDIASPAQAIAMAAANPRRLMHDTFARLGIAVRPSHVDWSDALQVVRVKIGDDVFFDG